MKNAFALALICYAAFCGIVSEPVSASALSPHPAWSDTAFPAHMLLAKKGTSAGRTTTMPTVNNVRSHAHEKYTRVVLDLSRRVKIKEKKDQRNATITLTNVNLSKHARQQIKGNGLPRAIVIASGDARTVTIVLDLQALRKYRVFTLRQPDRVAVDLFYAPKMPAVTAKPKTGTKNPSKPARQAQSRVAPSPLPSAKSPKDVLVIIDPGHGGRDPGTIGRKGTKEKTVVLQISKYLRDLIQRRHNAKVLLTRSKDVFLDLEGRVKFANRKKLQWCGGKAMRVNVEAKEKCLFISIHVNSHPRKSIKGLEVYYFGKASDPRALQVAARENGMKLENDTPPWQVIITDKVMDHTIEQSLTFAHTTSDKLVTMLRKHYKIKNHGVKTAPFYVLRFTNMPSILVEVGFISNSVEERRLRTKTFQKRLAEGIYQGIQAYLKAL
ncbi:MAG: N-acetylmuramoyl-L-alanine amidase [Nitrospira sp.]|nr:N-acetylmuramoyl-L-alanine amidase [Nitrospira sp.]